MIVRLCWRRWDRFCEGMDIVERTEGNNTAPRNITATSPRSTPTHTAMETGISEPITSSSALATAYASEHAILDRTTSNLEHQQQSEHHQAQAHRPCNSRLVASRDERPFNLNEFVDQDHADSETVLYLAYGSNLSVEKFRGARGIKPLSQINVQVPSLRLTFDLPGVPYTEPCFANSAKRDPEKDTPEDAADWAKVRRGYRKDAWHKGMIGVVYEVTAKDYAHIIATEGGGSTYEDVLVDCHPFVGSDIHAPVERNPSTPPFKAHTLFAPAVPPGEQPPKDGGRLQRPRPSYAQPSARYLKLITDGAAELGLPDEYQQYLLSIRPYRITTYRQRLGQISFSATWVPFVLLVLALGRMFQDKNGVAPSWVAKITAAIFKAVWTSYDNVFEPAFGDGERTIGDDATGMGGVQDRAFDTDLEKSAG